MGVVYSVGKIVMPYFMSAVNHTATHRYALGVAQDESFSDRLIDAAVQAEFETGEREETVAEAKSHIIVRLARMCLGFLIVIAGIIALPLPGPGWLIILAGLSILAKDFVWAARLMTFIRRRIPGIPEDGKIPPRTWAIMGAVMVAAALASVWWYVYDGKETVYGWF